MLQHIALLATIVGVALAGFQLLKNFLTFGFDSPPGPLLARFSDFWRFLDACFGQHHDTIVELHDRYGSVVRIGPNAISVADPVAIDSVLGSKANLDKTESVKPMQNPYKDRVMPMLISAIDSRTHAKIKKPIAGAYSMSVVLGLESVADEGITKLDSKLRDFNPGQRCRLDQWMSFFSFDFILQATFGRDFGFLAAGKDLNGLLAMLDLQFTYISTMGAMPWLDNFLLKNPLLLKFLRIPNPLVDFASDCVKARVSGDQKNDLRQADFLSRFIEAQKQYPETVDELQLITYATTNVLAASDTTSAALTAIIYHVLQHPAVHAKLQAELEAKHLHFPVSYNEAQCLPYLGAVIKEVLRAFPIAGIELERKVGPQGLTLPTGQRLPAGSIVGINAWPVHRNNAIFGADADKFVPERWLCHPNETEDQYQDRLKRMQRAYLAFGAGPRACLGRHVAFLQLYKVVATLFSVFKVRY